MSLWPPELELACSTSSPGSTTCFVCVQASQIAAQRAHSSSVLQMAGAAAGNAAPALQQHLAFSAALTAMAAAGPVGSLSPEIAPSSLFCLNLIRLRTVLIFNV